MNPLRAMIVGESDAGSRHLAAGLHADSDTIGELLHVDCSAVSPSALAGQLLGNGSSESGLLHRARGGTLVLEALERMPREVQQTLLGRLSNTALPGTVCRGNVRRINERHAPGIIGIVAGQLSKHLESGSIDSDLHSFLADALIVIPSLREREGDALEIACQQVAALNAETGDGKELSQELAERISAHDWPGNVTELKTTLRALYFASARGSVIEPNESVAPELGDVGCRLARALVGRSVWDVQRLLLMETLSSTGGDKKRTAKVLGISLKTLYNRLHAYNCR